MIRTPAKLVPFATALIVGACFPYIHNQRVPSPPASLQDSLRGCGAEVLVLVMWKDSVYRWSGANIDKGLFLARPKVIGIEDLSRLGKIADGRLNLGVAAFDGHAGTVHQDKEPVNMYVITPSGRVEWLASHWSSRDLRLVWTQEAWALLGPKWLGGLQAVAGTCKRLVSDDGECAVGDTLFTAALPSERPELRLSFGKRHDAALSDFLVALNESNKIDEQRDTWRFYEEG